MPDLPVERSTLLLVIVLVLKISVSRQYLVCKKDCRYNVLDFVLVLRLVRFLIFFDDLAHMVQGIAKSLISLLVFRRYGLCHFRFLIYSPAEVTHHII